MILVGAGNLDEFGLWACVITRQNQPLLLQYKVVNEKYFEITIFPKNCIKYYSLVLKISPMLIRFGLLQISLASRVYRKSMLLR